MRTNPDVLADARDDPVAAQKIINSIIFAMPVDPARSAHGGADAATGAGSGTGGDPGDSLRGGGGGSGAAGKAAASKSAAAAANQKKRANMSKAERALAELAFGGAGVKNSVADVKHSKREQRQLVRPLPPLPSGAPAPSPPIWCDPLLRFW